MSNIEQNLQKILASRYGKDVRQSIHDSIHDCYEDGKAGSVDLIARKRITNLTKLEEGSTTGDAELQDIRVAANGTVYESAGDAVRGQYEAIVSAIRSTLNISMASIVEYVDGKYINITDGRIEINSEYAYSDYIECSENALYELSGITGEVLIAYYDSEKQFIKGIVFGVDNLLFQTPPKTKYIIFSIKKVDKNTVNLNIGEKENINRNINDYYRLSLTDNRKYKPDLYISEGYPSWDDGHISFNADYSYTDYIIVPSDVELNIYGFTTDVNSICFYDESKIFISGTYNVTSITVPENTKYVRFGIPTSDTDEFYFELTTNKNGIIPIPNNVLIVSKEINNSKHYYNTINGALTYAYTIENEDNPITILIMPGIYEEVLFIQGVHYVNLIGVNRNECIIINETALYNNSPLRIQGQCYVANLTFISTANKYTSNSGTGKEAWITDVLAGVKNPEWLGTIGAYAVHCDDVTNGEYTVSRFENCKMYSETFPAFGSGMQINNRIELIGCELITRIDKRVYLKYPFNNSQGALLIHGKFPEENTPEPNQSCFIKDCYIEGINSRCVHMYPSQNAPKASIVFINNTFMNNHADSISDLIEFTFEEQYVEKCSHGNNLEFFNKNLLQE